MANPFSQFNNDTIRIISKDKSKTSSDFKVNFTQGKIDVFATDIDITKGDFLERDLPGNRKEIYEITDVTYNEKFMTFDAHYVLRIKKIG